MLFIWLENGQNRDFVGFLFRGTLVLVVNDGLSLLLLEEEGDLGNSREPFVIYVHGESSSRRTNAKASTRGRRLVISAYFDTAYWRGGERGGSQGIRNTSKGR